MWFSSTEVPEKKTKKNIIVTLRYSEGVQPCLFLHEEKMKQKKKELYINTHLFLLMQLKKNRYKPEWRQKRFEKIKQKKKKKTFSRWNLNGWMDEYKISQSEEVTHVSPSTHETFFLLFLFFFWDNMQFICLQHDVKNTLKYFRVHGKVWRRFKTIKNTKHTEDVTKLRVSGGNNNRNQSWYDNGCTLYKTRTNSHWESLWTQTKKLLKSSWVHLQCTYNMREEISTEFIYT